MQLPLLFAIGLLFGLGLIVSGMTDPGKVLGFLDLAGSWDPSLLFTMGGAVLVASVGFALARRRGRTPFGAPIAFPRATAIDRRLVIGSLVFGAGWGLAGFCPGPALASIGTGRGEPLLFVLAMVAGMGLFEVLEWLRSRGPAQA
jgi:uncharacterized membrane protein YedE/YeeE